MGPDHEASSDAELLLLIRAGDLDAMGALYARHREAGLRVARAVTGDPHLAEDLVAIAFERIHAALVRGHGPDESFRAYLYTVIRRLAAEHGEQRSREDDVADWEPYESATALADQTDGSIESRLVAKAFGALPERHQAVLWYLDVEGMTPAQAAPIFDLSPNAVSALAVRARDALRDAYVQAHVSDSPVRAACGPTRRLMGAYLRDSLSNRDRTKVDAHLEACDECPAVLAELRDVSRGLRSVFGPIIIGGLGLGIGAAAALGGGAQSASAAVAAAGTSAGSGAGSGIGAAAGTAAKHAASAGQMVAVGAVVVVGALVAATVASAAVNAFTGASTPPLAPVATATADAYPTLPIPTEPPATPTPTPSPSRPPAKPAPPPPPIPSASPPPLAALDIQLTDDGPDSAVPGGRLGSVVIQVRNTDSSPVGATLRVSLPDGMTFDLRRSAVIDPAWVCSPPLGASQSCVATGVPVGADLRLSIPVAIAAADLGARPIANLSITR